MPDEEGPEFRLERTAWGMVENADATVESLSVEGLRAELEGGETVLVDVRDVRKVWIEGSIPDAEHAPRGMIEFRADPETDYYRSFFHPENRYVLYCNAGGRSALAARDLREMGYPDVAHLGGFTAWRAADAPTVDVPQKDDEDR